MVEVGSVHGRLCVLLSECLWSVVPEITSLVTRSVEQEGDFGLREVFACE